MNSHEPEGEMVEATYPSDFRNPDGSKRAVAKKKYGMPKQHDQETDRYGRRKTVDEESYDNLKDRRLGSYPKSKSEPVPEVDSMAKRIEAIRKSIKKK